VVAVVTQTQGVRATTAADQPTGTLTRPIVVVDPGEPSGSKSGRRRASRQRRITFRVLLFFVLLAAVVYGGYRFVYWYAYDTYYVTADGQQLVIYQGHPGGVLGLQPRLVKQTGIDLSQIPPTSVSDVQARVIEPTLATAQKYVHNQRQTEIDQTESEQGETPGAHLTGPTTTTTTAPVPIPPPSSTTTTPGSPAPLPLTPTTAAGLLP
jgi:protein phosphatase